MSAPLRWNLIAVMFCAAALSGCSENHSTEPQPANTNSASSDSSAQTNAGKKTIIVTSLVLKELTETIADGVITVTLITPAEVPSRLWHPKVADIRRLQSADRILLQGAGYEPWKDRITVAQSKVVDTSSAYSEQLIEIPDFVTHQHGPEGEHSHAGLVWATYLDPELLSAQLTQVTAACVELCPEAKAEFEARAAKLSQEIDTLDQLLEQLKAQTVNPAGTTNTAGTASTDEEQRRVRLVADEPYAVYLGKRLDSTVTYLNWPEPPAPLTEKDRQKLTEATDRLSKEQPIVMLLRADRPVEDLEFVKSLGLRVATIDLCEKTSDTSESMVVRMKHNLESLQKAL